MNVCRILKTSLSHNKGALYRNRQPAWNLIKHLKKMQRYIQSPRNKEKLLMK